MFPNNWLAIMASVNDRGLNSAVYECSRTPLDLQLERRGKIRRFEIGPADTQLQAQSIVAHLDKYRLCVSVYGFH